MTILDLLPNLFYSLVSLVISFVSLLLKPIDMIISSLFPDLSNLLTLIGQLFTLISSGIGWVISLTGLSYTAINLVVLYYTFAVTASLTVYTVKLAIKWYNKLKT